MKWHLPIWYLLLCLLGNGTAYAQESRALLEQRQTYQSAFKALKAKQFTRYHQLHRQLGDYALRPYLTYRYLRLRLADTSAKTIETFLIENDDTFYAKRLRVAWLSLLAKRKDWRTYLSFYRDTGSAELQCYQLTALAAIGQQKKAFERVPEMWLVPHSQHKACNPIFQQWQQAGLLTQDLRQQRFNLAIDEKQFSIAKFLAKSSDNSDWLLAQVERWQTMQSNPLTLLKQLPAAEPSQATRFTLARDTETTRPIIVYGLTRLARQNPDKAFETWQRLKDHYSFSDTDKQTVHTAMGLWAALNRDDKALTYFGEAQGHEWHARAALWQQDWNKLQKVVDTMDASLQGSTRWQYWLGRSMEARGDEASAQTIYQQIHDDRDYYAFLAADRLKIPYSINHRPIPTSEDTLNTMRARADIQRMHEFYIQDMQLEAKREYHHFSLSASSEELQQLAVITYQWGWHPQTIAILGKAQYWDAVNLRFPVLFHEEMKQAGQITGLNPSWLMAIARQESAFNPQARSHAGARGLMQLMPATGKLTAKLIKAPLKHTNELYQPDRNISLGSAYLRKMLDENQGNPVLATASYNAGPHRVVKWLPKQSLEATIWAENIPFNETRHYVQNVMTYAAIFDHQRNQAIKPLTQRMPAVQPKKP